LKAGLFCKQPLDEKIVDLNPQYLLSFLLRINGVCKLFLSSSTSVFDDFLFEDNAVPGEFFNKLVMLCGVEIITFLCEDVIIFMFSCKLIALAICSLLISVSNTLLFLSVVIFSIITGDF
jgi:hypothetical protein